MSVDALNFMEIETKYIVRIKFRSIHNDFEMEQEFYTIPDIADLISTERIPREKIMNKMPKNLKLADHRFYIPAPIDMRLSCGPTMALLSIGLSMALLSIAHL